jgi:hypothetical protein
MKTPICTLRANGPVKITMRKESFFSFAPAVGYDLRRGVESRTRIKLTTNDSAKLFVCMACRLLKIESVKGGGCG